MSKNVDAMDFMFVLYLKHGMLSSFQLETTYCSCCTQYKVIAMKFAPIFTIVEGAKIFRCWNTQQFAFGTCDKLVYYKKYLIHLFKELVKN